MVVLMADLSIPSPETTTMKHVDKNQPDLIPSSDTQHIHASFNVNTPQDQPERTARYTSFNNDTAVNPVDLTSLLTSSIKKIFFPKWSEKSSMAKWQALGLMTIKTGTSTNPYYNGFVILKNDRNQLNPTLPDDKRMHLFSLINDAFSLPMPLNVQMVSNYERLFQTVLLRHPKDYLTSKK